MSKKPVQTEKMKLLFTETRPILRTTPTLAPNNSGQVKLSSGLFSNTKVEDLFNCPPSLHPALACNSL